MSTISRIKLPSGDIYDIKDAVAREIAGGGIHFRGVTTTPLADESTVSSYVINGSTLTAENGDFVLYGKKEFVFSSTDNKWHELGDNSSLGALANKDSASGTFTPHGTVSAPVISVATQGTTATIRNPTKQTVAKTVVSVAPGLTAPDNNLTYYNIDGETLSLYQLGYTTGDSIATVDVTVKTGDAAYSASAPTFTGDTEPVTVS